MREVEKLLRLPRSTIRALIEAGFVAPARGPRKAWLFSFQDLIVLRTAQAPAAAKVAPKRITRSMKTASRSKMSTVGSVTSPCNSNGKPASCIASRVL